jgi:hypothetical protein
VWAGQVDTITGAREICAKLCNIANDLIAEVEHTIKYHLRVIMIVIRTSKSGLAEIYLRF